MTTPNSNRPILSLRPKAPVILEVTQAKAIEVKQMEITPEPAKAKKITNAGAIRKLKKLFPLAFFGSKEGKLPLAYGIHKQLLSAETGFSRKRIRKAIYWYTSRPSYHKGVIDSENRINLDGSIASAVTDEDKGYAAGRIAVIEEAKALRDADIQPIDLLGG